MNLLIAPNSFKECATSNTVAKLIYQSFSNFLPEDFTSRHSITLAPISDGGDGFLAVVKEKFSLEEIDFEITSPWGVGKIKTSIGYLKSERRVFIESAKVLGLNLIPPSKRNPLLLSSVGLGEILFGLANQKELHVEEVLIGIGGTGTNDLAIGALQVLGLEFADGSKEKINALPENFNLIEEIVNYPKPLPFKIKLIADVENPLLGENGATRIYGPQKGIKEEEFEIFEKGFEKIISLAKVSESRKSVLSGAGGGLAAGFQIFYDAELIPAESFIKNFLGINSKALSPDLIITGEGKLDEQTLMGKGIGVILNEFPAVKKVIICGTSDLKGGLKDSKIIELKKFFQSEEDSMKFFEKGIELAVEKIVADYFN